MAVARTLEQSKKWMTEEEFMALGTDFGKAELVDGEAIKLPVNFEYDVVASMIGHRLIPYALGRGYIAAGQAGFRMANRNIRSPDVSFTLKSRLPDGKPGKWFVM